MKWQIAMLLCLFFSGSLLQAAVINVSGTGSGSAYSPDFGTTADCSRSFDAPNNGSASCIDPRGSYITSAGASGDRYTGFVGTQSITDSLTLLDSEGEVIDHLLGQSSGSATLTYAQDFYLSGGSGQVILNLDNVFNSGTSDGESSALCTLSVNSQAFSGCGGDFAVTFFAPIQLTMSLYAHSAAAAGDINFGFASYDLNSIQVMQDGQVVHGAILQPVPETLSFLTMFPGLVLAWTIKHFRRA